MQPQDKLLLLRGRKHAQKPKLKQTLLDTVATCEKEVSQLEEKKAHVDKAYEKVQEDFQEFVKGHLVESKEGEKSA